MDTSLRKAEKAFSDPTPETAERLACELQRSGKTPTQAAEQLLEATAAAIKKLVLEEIRIEKLPNTTVVVIDDALRILEEYRGHAEQRPCLIFQGEERIGLTEHGIFRFEDGWTPFQKVAEKIQRTGSSVRAPRWGSQNEETGLYLSHGIRALRFLANHVG